jgi:nucleoside phosphorylase
LAAGEEFVASEQERGKIRVLTDAEAVDMNTFGLALVCADQNVPLFVWRIISDRANETAADDFRSFVSTWTRHDRATSVPTPPLLIQLSNIY